MATTIITDYEELFSQTLTDILVSGPVSSALLRVLSGGRAVSATASNGRIILDKGGKCEIATLLNGGELAISSGSASDVKISSGGSIDIYGYGSESKAVAIVYNATVSSGGIMNLYVAGTASNTEVMNGGKLILDHHYSSYGPYGFNCAYDTTLYGGSMEVRYSAYAKSNIVSAGTIEVLSGGYAKDNTIKPDGIMNVSSGGTATSNHVSGIMNVGGTATSNTVDSDGTLNVLFGGKALGGTVNTGGSMYVNSGGSASGFTLSGLGIMVVSSGGEATGTVMSGGLQSIEGESYNGTYMNGYAVVQPGGSSVEETILSGAVFIVSGDDTGKGKVSGATIGSGASVSILGGRLTGKTVSNAYIELSDGYAELTDLNGAVADISGGKFHASGGNMSSATVSDYGYGYSKGWMYVSSGATVEKVSVNANAELEIEAGGSVTSANISGSSSVSGVVNVGGTLDSVYVGKGGELSVQNGGTLKEGKVFGTILISSGGTASDLTVTSGGSMLVDGIARNVQLGNASVTLYDGVISGITISSGGRLSVYIETSLSTCTVSSGGVLRLTGNDYSGIRILSGGTLTNPYDCSNITISSGAIVDLDISGRLPNINAFVRNLSDTTSKSLAYTLTVKDNQDKGKYGLASGAAGFDKTISVVNTEGTTLGTLEIGQTVDIGGVNYKLELGSDDVLSVTIGSARSDIDANGISDVLFQYTGGDYQLGYWMNGTNEWRGQGLAKPAEWEVLGSYDMNANGKADSVLIGNVEVSGIKGAYIGYYLDSVDTDDNWRNIGYLTNEDNIPWTNKVGNLTGNASGVNSIVWYSPKLFALGVWKDGKEDWATISSDFGGAFWTLVGCGDFNGDGKDSVLMCFRESLYYSVDLDGTSTPLGSSNWSGWKVCAIGDFSGDQKDDIVLYDNYTGAMVLCIDGNTDNYRSIGQLDKKDWFVVGAGDYNGDNKDDLLVRQKSTGLLGYYSAGKTSYANWNWVELGRGVDMNWTVIA